MTLCDIRCTLPIKYSECHWLVMGGVLDVMRDSTEILTRLESKHDRTHNSPLSNLSDAAEAALLAITNIVETGEELRAVTHFKITQFNFNMERVNLKRHHHVSHHFMY